MTGLPPLVSYRLIATISGAWFVQWLMGRCWVTIHGPCGEGEARTHMYRQLAQPLPW